jgi:hypothetical protein
LETVLAFADRVGVERDAGKRPPGPSDPGSTSEPLGGDYYIKRRPGTAIRKTVEQLRAAGYTTTITDHTTATLT